jgi:hypothetical protein
MALLQGECFRDIRRRKYGCSTIGEGFKHCRRGPKNVENDTGRPGEITMGQGGEFSRGKQEFYKSHR